MSTIPSDPQVSPAVPVKRTFGIDLGTTYSAISWYDAENQRRLVNIELVEAADGAKEIRSVVYYPGPGQPPVVGETAWNAARQSPERVISLIKRAMGTDYKWPAIDGVEHTPPEVSAEILKVLVKEAQTHVAEEVKDVVITVPAYFGEAERNATLRAGELAGLNVLQLLDEPHAAALAFAIDRASEVMDRHLLVYDLGGGTFDVTLIHAAAVQTSEGIDLKIETLCKEGKRELGGADWDAAMAQWVAERVKQEQGVDPLEDPRNKAILLDNCERAKRDLGRTSLVTVSAGLSGHQIRMTREDFEERTRDLLMTTEMLIDIVLEDAKKPDKKVLIEKEQQLGEAEKDRLVKERISILLVGGSSRMPMVRQMLTAKMGKPPLQHGNPNLLVTSGAAYKAHLLQAGATVVTEKGPVGIEEVAGIAAHAIGIEEVHVDGEGVPRKTNKVFLPAGTKYGDEPRKKVYQTTEDGMTEISIVLYEGDSPDVDQCRRLMEFTIAGLPPDRPKGQLVKVQLGYDKNGIIRGTAVDVASNKPVDIVIDRSPPADPVA
jgi:molecular chaperone DnaK